MLLGLMGDTHGMVGWAKRCYEAFDRATDGEFSAVLQVGDLGADWPVNIGSDPFVKGDHLNFLAEKYDAPLIYSPGNHDNWPHLLQQEVEPEGYRKVREHVWMLHSNVMTFKGVRIAGLGGATSSDKGRRLEYEMETGFKSWWQEEEISRVDARQLIEAAGDEPVDVLITHEVPVGIADDFLPTREGVSMEYALNAQIDRLLIRTVHEALQPRLHVTGHHHLRRSIRLHDGRRIEMMGRDGQIHGMAAIYDTETKSIENIVLEEW